MTYRICGGTLFSLLTAVRRGAGRARAVFMGETMPVTDAAMLSALLRILNPEHRVCGTPEALRSATSSYKACRYRSCADVPLEDSRYTTGFHRRVAEDFPAILRNTKAFCDAFLDTEDPEKMAWLGRAMLEVFTMDPAVRAQAARQPFPLHVRPDGKTSTFREVAEAEQICLPAFLAGMLDYIVMHVPDNTVGRETIEDWTKDREIAHRQAILPRSIGSHLNRKVSVTLEIPTTEDAEPAAAPVKYAASEAPDRESAEAVGRPVPDGEPPETSGRPVPDREPSEAASRPDQAQPGSMSFSAFPHPGAGAGCPAAVYSGINILGPMSGDIHYYAPRESGGFPALELNGLNREFYSLFVLEEEDFTGGRFTVPIARALKDYIDPEIRKAFLPMGAAEIARLTGMPALFGTVNREWNRTDGDQPMMLGRVTGARVQRDGIRFEWKPYGTFPQQILNENEARFGLCCSEANNELSEAHWTVKRAPLLAALRENGVNPPAFSGFGFAPWQ